MKLREPTTHPVTLALRKISAEGPEAATQLLPVLYDELRRLARALMSNQPAGHTLQATALVHEAYLRLVPQDDPGWNHRGHFFGAAARAMRQILVDQARKKNSKKHGGDYRRIQIEIDSINLSQGDVNFLALDEALDALAVLDERKVDVVLLRYLTGLSVAETAAALGVSESTVALDWKFSRVFLFDYLSPDSSDEVVNP